MTAGQAEKHLYAELDRTAPNLWLGARALDPLKRRFFVAAYASMRIIDDLVDCTSQPAEQKCDAIDSWLEAVEGAKAGHAPEAGRWGSEPALAVLSDIWPNVAIPLDPWDDLAKSMKADASGRKIMTWEGFELYCMGASIAPARVFLGILCSRQDGGRLSYDTSEDLLDHTARAMGLFCYQVHIIRDIAKDLGGPDQLVTIPEGVLKSCGFESVSDLRKVFELSGFQALTPLIAMLQERADEYRTAALRAYDRIAHEMPFKERMLLRALLKLYEGQHELNGKPAGYGNGSPGRLSDEEKRKIISDAVGEETA